MKRPRPMKALISTLLLCLAAPLWAAPYTDANWFALGTGTNGPVNAIAVDGNTVYAGGDFTQAGGVAASNIAKWNGTSWSPLGVGLNGTVHALLFKNGVLYAGGSFTLSGATGLSRVASWNGTAWSALGAGLDDTVRALAVAGNGDLYAGGSFAGTGLTFAEHLAKWNGTTWSGLGDANDELDGPVHALAFDSTGNLYAGGDFIETGFAPPGSEEPEEIEAPQLNRIGKWNGTSWSPLGTGMDDTVRALAVTSTDQLYAGGSFTTAGGAAGSFYIAFWNGFAWDDLDLGMGARVSALTLDSAGRLYAGGTFSLAGSAAAEGIAVWESGAWSALGSGIGTPPSVAALAAVGEAILVGGDFDTAGGRGANYIARLGAATTPPAKPAPPRISVSRLRAFEATKVESESRPQTLTVTNSGKILLRGLSLSLSGRARKEFSLSQPLSRTLAPGKSTKILVTFHPAKPGRRSATIRVTGNAKPVAVSVSGMGEPKPLPPSGHLPGAF